MARKIFVTLPVKNRAESKDFFARPGFSFHTHFTDEQGACMVVSEDIFVMLLAKNHFKDFTKKPISNAKTRTEVLLCLSAGSHEEVDDVVVKALAADGTAHNPKQDHGFMYGHGFDGLEGPSWEVMWMDPSAIQ